MFNSTKTLLTNSMMIGVIITICSNNWISMWIGLEITLISFIPMMQTNKLDSSEAAIKYFIVQSVASTLMLLSISIKLIGVSLNNEVILVMSMLMKIGSAPFHNWVIMIIETLNFYEMWILLTILKMPPLTILYYINSTMLNMPIILSMTMSSMLCLNQTSMRKTLGYSSIYNMSMMLMASNKFNITLTLMSVYSMILSLMVSILSKMKISFINQIVLNEKHMYMKINLWINMLSMGGFPPMLGFINKMIIIQFMVNDSKILLSSIMMLTSMLVMLFYMRLVFTSMMTNSTSTKWMSISNYYSYFSLILNLLMFPTVISLSSIMY